MTTTSSEAAALEAIERLTKKAAARRAACVQMAKHRRPADLDSAVADEVAGATVPSVLLSDLEAILSGLAILPLPQVGEGAVERAAMAMCQHATDRHDDDACPWEDVREDAREELRGYARAALSTISPSPGAGVEWRGIDSNRPPSGEALIWGRPEDEWGQAQVDVGIYTAKAGVADINGAPLDWPTHWQPLPGAPSPVGAK